MLGIKLNKEKSTTITAFALYSSPPDRRLLQTRIKLIFGNLGVNLHQLFGNLYY